MKEIPLTYYCQIQDERDFQGHFWTYYHYSFTVSKDLIKVHLSEGAYSMGIMGRDYRVIEGEAALALVEDPEGAFFIS